MSRRLTWVTLTTAALTFAIGPTVERSLSRLGTWDVPNSRSSHRRPTPRGGGLAPLAGASVATLYHPTARPSRKGVYVVVGMAGLGFADDVSGHVSARTRLMLQLASGTVLAGPALTDKVLGASLAAAIVNATNFMDGINGISSITALVWGINAMQDAPDTTPSPDHSETLEKPINSDLQLLGALVTGGALGFLPHNVPTARLFLGDTGSYALGAAVTAGILSKNTLSGRYRAASPLLLYGLDTAQALINRQIAGQPFAQPHRDHIYQQLVDSGIGHTTAATFHGLLAASISGQSRSMTARRAVITLALCGTYLLSPHVARWLRPALSHRLQCNW